MCAREPATMFQSLIVHTTISTTWPVDTLVHATNSSRNIPTCSPSHYESPCKEQMQDGTSIGKKCVYTRTSGDLNNATFEHLTQLAGQARTHCRVNLGCSHSEPERPKVLTSCDIFVRTTSKTHMCNTDRQRDRAMWLHIRRCYYDPCIVTAVCSCLRLQGPRYRSCSV